MLIAEARSAGVLATSIDAIDVRIAAINLALTNSAVISGGSIAITDAVAGTSTNIVLVPQNAADSASVFNTMLTILQAKRDALAGQLTALS